MSKITINIKNVHIHAGGNGAKRGLPPELKLLLAGIVGQSLQNAEGVELGDGIHDGVCLGTISEADTKSLVLDALRDGEYSMRTTIGLSTATKLPLDVLRSTLDEMVCSGDLVTRTRRRDGETLYTLADNT